MGIVDEFFDLKQESEADLLAMQVGDFYEFFGDDARTVADELDLKVSEKSNHGSTYPMAGVPVDDLTPYLKSLVERGYRVAVGDQREDANGDLSREVTRIVTPGTLLETTDADAQYLAAVVREESGDGFGLAFVDVTTGRFHVTQVDSEADAFTELYRFAPAEVLPGPALRDDEAFLSRVRERTDATCTLHVANAFAPGKARHAVHEQFGEGALESVGVAADGPAARAAGATLDYVAETGVGVLTSLSRLQPYRADDHVEIDATTQRNLELTETMQGGRSGSLFDAIDHTVTSAGGRLLKEWLQRPRQSLDELERRQESVAELAQGVLAREAIRETLNGSYDLERLASRVAHGSADANDLLRIEETLARLPTLAERVSGDPSLATSPLTAVIDEPDHDTAESLRGELDSALAENPPKTVTQGGLFEQGYDDALDDVIERHEAVKEWIDGLAQREKQEHSISHLQVDRNKTDGYYIQVGKSQVEQVPEHYREVKTLKNSKRYTTDALDEREREILRLEEERGDLEYRLFEDLRERVAERATVLQDVGRMLAELDVLASLATHAAEHDWTRPDLTPGDDLAIDAGRHPVVERTTEFVPNDAEFGSGRRFVVVTGPNMSGKSTYMRQVALIVLLAQVGSFVPARDARIGLVDGIYTRVGALDELAQGRSTFMVEMQELSRILHAATEDSLVILDEVGRGTATYDGISIAWAATEYLHNEVRAKTLFATHYHELTTLADHLEDVANVHIAVDERDGEVTFLRTVDEGPTDRSYGVHVADLAGVPRPVVDRADDVLTRLREDKAIEAKGGGSGGEPKQAVFDLGSGSFEQATSDGGKQEREQKQHAAERDESETESASADEPTLTAEQREVIEDITGTSLNNLTPIEALNKIQQWQNGLRDFE